MSRKRTLADIDEAVRQLGRSQESLRNPAATLLREAGTDATVALMWAIEKELRRRTITRLLILFLACLGAGYYLYTSWVIASRDAMYGDIQMLVAWILTVFGLGPFVLGYWISGLLTTSYHARLLTLLAETRDKRALETLIEALRFEQTTAPAATALTTLLPQAGENERRRINEPHWRLLRRVLRNTVRSTHRYCADLDDNTKFVIAVMTFLGNAGDREALRAIRRLAERQSSAVEREPIRATALPFLQKANLADEIVRGRSGT